MICPKCGSENTFDDWDNPDDHGLIINHNWKCRDCGWDDSKKPMTNGDKIRAMSDEELAKFLWNIHARSVSPLWLLTLYPPYANKPEILNWLRKDAESK